MKGIKLSIDILVVVAATVIVLLGIFASYFTFFGGEPMIAKPCEDLQISLMNGYDGRVECFWNLGPGKREKAICDCYFYKIITVDNSTYGQLEKTETYDILEGLK